MNPDADVYRDFIDRIHRHQRVLHRICEVYGHTAEDREDLYQDILVQALAAFDSFEGRAKFSTWLYRVALNTALMRRRKEARRRDTQAAVDVAAPTDDTPDDVELLHRCIDELRELDRAIIVLHLEQHDYDEIAAITGLSRGNVSVRLVRIKERLRRMLVARGCDTGCDTGRNTGRAERSQP